MAEPKPRVVRGVLISYPGDGDTLKAAEPPFWAKGETPDLTPVYMAKQINNGPLRFIDRPYPTKAGETWQANVSQTECPLADTWYVLTVYAWNQSGNSFSQSHSFKTP